MNFLRHLKSFHDPEEGPLEVVERKGLGHPDTLADGIAHAVSVAYSSHTLDTFGYVLHHNVDKVYVGGGMAAVGFGSLDFQERIRVVVNGRMSTSFEGRPIDIEGIAKQAIKTYFRRTIPALDPDRHLSIVVNPNQFTDVSPFWYRPRGVEDLPEQARLMANDTAICVAHQPRTTCERLAYELERWFWVETPQGRQPRFGDVGQDIKVMVWRESSAIEVTLCVPLLGPHLSGWDQYHERLATIEVMLREEAEQIAGVSGYRVSLKVNPARDGGYRKYLLGFGTCAECGEEGLVGRGNTNHGVISINRAHTMEAPMGKNPMYHTGRVMGYMTAELSRHIHQTFGVRNTVFALTRNQCSLLPPERMFINARQDLPMGEIAGYLEQLFASDYVRAILDSEVP